MVKPEDVKEVLKNHLLENHNNRLSKHSILGLIELITVDLNNLGLFESPEESEE